ncbi:MAG: hypothetical protein JO199_08710 [Candidatus Eremiobacteraeota bacterium]|nr:hypothetical protein [Candidatus Eremiobacteraeota bacterium]
MNVEPIVPDTAFPPASSPPDRAGFAAALDALGGVLSSAQHAEDAFAVGTGPLHEAVYERARADVALAVATAAAQRAATAITSILNMQV